MSAAAQADFPTPVPDAQGANLRQHPRIVCVDGGVLRLAVRPEFRGRRALMLDISTGGIGFLLQDPLEPGTNLVFELRSAAGLETVGRVACVRHCRPHPMPADAPWLDAPPLMSRIFRSMFRQQAPSDKQAWFVGCEFNRPLRDSELKVFLEHLQGARIG
jgi:PilZ domain